MSEQGILFGQEPRKITGKETLAAIKKLGDGCSKSKIAGELQIDKHDKESFKQLMKMLSKLESAGYIMSEQKEFNSDQGVIKYQMYSLIANSTEPATKADIVALGGQLKAHVDAAVWKARLEIINEIRSHD